MDCADMLWLILSLDELMYEEGLSDRGANRKPTEARWFDVSLVLSCYRIQREEGEQRHAR